MSNISCSRYISIVDHSILNLQRKYKRWKNFPHLPEHFTIFIFGHAPAWRLCRNYLKCEFVILNEVKNLTKSIRYKTEILRLGPQNDNCDTVSKPENDN